MEKKVNQYSNTSRQTFNVAKNALAGSKIKAIAEGLKLAHSFRKKVEAGDNSPFLIALIAAILIDLADLSVIVGLLLKPALFYFLWGKGTFKVKITIRIALFLDCIPGVSWLPLSTISVLYAWRHISKEAEESKNNLEKIEDQLKILEKTA